MMVQEKFVDTANAVASSEVPVPGFGGAPPSDSVLAGNAWSRPINILEQASGAGVAAELGDAVDEELSLGWAEIDRDEEKAPAKAMRRHGRGYRGGRRSAAKGQGAKESPNVKKEGPNGPNVKKARKRRAQKGRAGRRVVVGRGEAQRGSEAMEKQCFGVRQLQRRTFVSCWAFEFELSSRFVPPPSLPLIVFLIV